MHWAIDLNVGAGIEAPVDSTNGLYSLPYTTNFVLITIVFLHPNCKVNREKHGGKTVMEQATRLVGREGSSKPSSCFTLELRTILLWPSCSYVSLYLIALFCMRMRLFVV